MNTEPTIEQIEAFREAWLRADAENRIGERIRDGLAAALAVPDEPAPSPDLSLIPSSREEARPVEVNGSLGTYWLCGDLVLRLGAYGGPSLACMVGEITSVREVRVLADDEKVADSGMASRSRAWFAISAHPIFRGCLDGDVPLLDGMTSRLDEVMALIERAQAWDAWYEDRATATVKPENGVEILRDLAAVDRGEGR